MAVSTNQSGSWKSAEGTIAEVLGQLDTDSVGRQDVYMFAQDGTDNIVAVYYNA